MRIAKIMKNDTVNGVGICVSLWVQGCPHKCRGCHNPETWDFNGGFESNDLTGALIKMLTANNVKRNFSILGGEPLAPQNRSGIASIMKKIRVAIPDLKIFLWTGYTLEELQAEDDADLDYILMTADYLIEGRYIEEQRDLSLWLRGSSNQNIYRLTDEKTYVKINNKGEM